MGIAEFAAAGRMTETAYLAARDALRATYGDTAVERTGLFDQELARLFYRSGWTQEQLATAEGKSQKWVSRRLLFGRFLGFIPTGIFPKSLTERRFLGYWERIDKTETNERVRFLAVQQLMEAELTFSKDRSKTTKLHVAKAILRTAADGHWHLLRVIVEKAQALDPTVTEPDVVAVLTQMLTRGTYHTSCERRKGGTSWSYRILRGQGHKVDVDVLVHELSPIVQALKVEGKKHVALASPGTIARLAHQLEAILERLAHDTALQSRSAHKEQDPHGSVSVTEV